jgi:hypothetical protein
MSTLAELIDECEDRIPKEKMPRLFPIFNLALRVIAKRLRILGSDLVRGELSVSLWAEKNYTASTIAFVDGGDSADSITDSASDFVDEGFAAGMHITTDAPNNAGPFTIETAAAGTLTLVSTDTVVAAGAGSAVTITSEDGYGDLPSDFWGLIDRPYIDGYTWRLSPIPDEDTKLIYTSAGLAKYFQIVGADKIQIWPPASTDITVKGPYFKRPAKITDMEDVLPWNEIFDDVLVEFLSLWMRGEQATQITTYLLEQVDLITPLYGYTAPRQMPRSSIDWDCLIGGDD